MAYIWTSHLSVICDALNHHAFRSAIAWLWGHNKQQHGVTDLSDDETPVSGHPRQEDTKKVMKKEQQEPSQMPKPPSLAEMFRVVTWPQDIFENKEEYGIEELAEEKGLEWHELSCSLRHFYEERSAMQVCALIVFMMKAKSI